MGKGRTVSGCMYKVGHVFEAKIDSFKILEDLGTRINKTNRKARWFLVECVECKTQKEIVYTAIPTKSVGCKVCGLKFRGRKAREVVVIVNDEQKAEIAAQIDAIYEDMKWYVMNGMGVQYFLDKGVPESELFWCFGEDNEVEEDDEVSDEEIDWTKFNLDDE